MELNPNIRQRWSIRLKHYDYSRAGLYFITICIQNRLPLLGEIVEGKMLLNAAGDMISFEWLNLTYRLVAMVLHAMS
ncbi:MAG: hypothetical protein PHG00_16000 [Methylococcales bacterium]|nr:hypothetical protein [Methylococcales bacterium]